MATILRRILTFSVICTMLLLVLQFGPNEIQIALTASYQKVNYVLMIIMTWIPYISFFSFVGLGCVLCFQRYHHVVKLNWKYAMTIHQKPWPLKDLHVVIIVVAGMVVAIGLLILTIFILVKSNYLWLSILIFPPLAYGLARFPIWIAAKMRPNWFKPGWLEENGF